MSDPPHHPSGQAAGSFATTLWTVVLQAASHDSTESRAALEHLCRSYWYPLYAYLRRRGYSPQDAEDLTQGFIAHLIERRAFKTVSQDKGRFRSFLLAALRNYLADQRDRACAAKRGGGKPLLSLDDFQSGEARYSLESSNTTTPEREFDRRWALAILERALEVLAQEQIAAGKGALFERLRVFLLDTAEKRDYSAAAAELNLSPNTTAVIVGRLRKRYRALVQNEVVATLATPGETESEMRHLLLAVRG